MATPSERITLIQEIANRLSGEDWGLIDLTLDQFSLPTRDEYQGRPSDYVIRMVSNAASDTLEQLAAHLGFSLANERPGVEPDFWAPGHFRLFACHLAEERQFTTDLKESLEEFQISTFVAHRDITPTRAWINEIQLALTTADALLALLHPGFHASSWTDQEVGWVIGRGRLAVAIRLGEEPYGFIGQLQAFQGKDASPDELARNIFDAFVKTKQTGREMAFALIARLEQSQSYWGAKRNMELLESIQHWEGSFKERILRAVRENRQVRDSFGVPERGFRLIQKWMPSSDLGESETEATPSESEDIPFE